MVPSSIAWASHWMWRAWALLVVSSGWLKVGGRISNQAKTTSNNLSGYLTCKLIYN